MADWIELRERGGVIEHRLRITPEGVAPRYARVYEMLAGDGWPYECHAQVGSGYITRHSSVAKARASVERNPRVAAFLSTNSN